MDYFEISDLDLKSRPDKKNSIIKDYSHKKEMGDFLNTFDGGSSIGVLLNKYRFSIMIIFMIGIWVLILGRVFYLQVIRGDDYRIFADKNRIRIKRVEPNRGIIYDKNLKPLLKNGASFSLQIVPIDLPENNDEFLKVQNILRQALRDNELDLSKYVSDNTLENFQPRIIKESLDYDDAMKLMVTIKNLNGVSVVIKNKREYIYKEMLSHILGYMGKISENEYLKLKDSDYYLDDKIGQTGLEYSYENYLRGKFGKRKIEVNSLGQEIKEVAYEKPIDGKNLVLSLDWDLQTKIYELLSNVLNKTGFKKASIVAVDPRNGRILSILSLPSYDNNIFSEKLDNEKYKQLVEDENFPMFFRAISGEYPPGSTFKLIVACAGLQEKIIDTKTSFLSTGGIRFGQWFFPDWKSGGHGITNVKKAIAESVNTFFYIVGGGNNDFQGLGLEKIVEYGKKFGLSEKLGVDLPSEADGFLPTEKWKKETKNEAWYIGDTYHLSIGQGDALVTPLQVAMMTSVIANGGILYEPKIVDSIVENTGAVNKMPINIKNSNFISKENIAIVQDGMREGVISGSSRFLNTLPFATAGKTGTAQFGNEGKTHAWFTGYAPYENPEIVITIIIEGGGEGSSVAVPLARDILLWYLEDRQNEVLP
ncbi:MAG TPA: penicillin-binding protein 2 [bacterium]|jgi:penicillin-binding protein 2|nr:penicillin-binding protein 2 [bacterium]HOG38188.1 penicillin-binding protein 2 [bacterium]HQI03222.1 penicillin-binding protein 2 [bacterium]